MYPKLQGSPYGSEFCSRLLTELGPVYRSKLIGKERRECKPNGAERDVVIRPTTVPQANTRGQYAGMQDD